LDSIEGLSRIDQAQSPPERALGVDPEIRTVLRGKYFRYLPASIPVGRVLARLPVHVVNENPEILHDQLRVEKNPGIQALQNKWLS
jgi:hypothetical protein